jgi:hypothetical protein
MPDDDSWLLSQNAVGTAVHAIAYSLTGRTLPVGETVVARINGGCVAIGSAMLVDADAQEIITRTSIHTAIVQPSVSDSNGEVYSVDGIKRDTDIRHKGLRIVNGKKKMVK